MSITITDPNLKAQIARLTGPVDVLDDAGEVIARVEPVVYGKLPPGVKSPFSDEEMAERWKCTTGRPLADIIRNLEARRSK